MGLRGGPQRKSLLDFGEVKEEKKKKKRVASPRELQLVEEQRGLIRPAVRLEKLELKLWVWF